MEQEKEAGRELGGKGGESASTTVTNFGGWRAYSLAGKGVP